MAITITQAQLDAMVEAYMSGVSTVKFADREVTYRSMDELLAAIQFAESKLNPSSVTSTSANVTPTFSKEQK